MAKTDEDLLQDLKDATIFVEEQTSPKTYNKGDYSDPALNIP
jgi:hypothetical protein